MNPMVWLFYGIEEVDDNWMLAEFWFPFRFPGYFGYEPSSSSYISNTVTLSTAAAITLEGIIGSPYFPGGLHEVSIDEDFFLVEDELIDPFTIQYVSFFDVAMESALGEIWGGINTPQGVNQALLSGAGVAGSVLETILEDFDQVGPEIIEVIPSNFNLNDDDIGTFTINYFFSEFD